MNEIRDSRFEIRRTSESRTPSPESLPALAAIALIFLASRIVLLYARAPFFDELFTVWMARQPLASVVPNVLHDSGPPLYYWLARFDSVRDLRWLSLLVAIVQLVIVVFFTRSSFPLAPHPRFAQPLPAGEVGRRPGEGRAITLGFVAAALLAVYPPAVLFAVDARAYALCALFITIGVLALAAERPFAAAGAFVLAGYCHYYGVLFFPVILTGVAADFSPAQEKVELKSATSLKTRAAAFAAACIAFIPGFVLAAHQPPQAMGWNREPLFAPLLNLSWGGTYPESLFSAAPAPLALLATGVLLVAVSRSFRFAPPVLVPLALVAGFHLAGRPVYFPMRFESIIAAPLALWVASSLAAMPARRYSTLIAAILIVLGAGSIWSGVTSHLSRPADSYRAAATVLRGEAAPDAMVVATGFCYLESAVALKRPVIAWPAEQAQHPGWRAETAGNVRDLPPGSFIWIGERRSPELARLREARGVRPLFLNERAVVARVENLTAPLH